MSEKLEVQDLINVGIFTALYFLIMFASGMLGFIPIIFLFFPLYMPIISSIPFMLFLTKVKKFGMVTIMSIILGLLMFATGHTWVPLVATIICGFFADLIFKAGKYQSFKHTVLGYSIFSFWLMGAMLPLWIMRDSYFAYIRESMGKEYANAIFTMTPVWIAYVMVGVIFIAGIIGAFFGKAILKKHFKRAGIL
ncbi:MptD family putative ECF transporter S component [Iocasia frigidifontis]|uniref:MptD family putative ECF transporter S component n=1 Tax=Iocasia fonsfrigidae TaxID=2682810 RepID=A0A8A7KGL8_9FIRM|nr:MULTISPECIES: MptD family putative ECF transporter S component [Halanaerobiaceae]AZO95981.1 Trep_Strep domain-containing protein [Halocella sp. SP3-1]QTL98868.1 MptD family putative ECF transporter S component [Iocasia fonsfrigidae]